MAGRALNRMGNHLCVLCNTGVFAFISFVLMAGVPHITEGTQLNAKTLFDHSGGNCAQDPSVLDGSFNYAGYKAVLGCGVFAWFYALLMLAYYLVPINAEVLWRHPCYANVDVPGASLRVNAL